MKKKTARLLSALCVLALLVGLLPLGVAAAAEHTVWIVGDSTVCDFGTSDAKLYYPRYGYGTQIGNYLDGSYEVKNLALSGRSSKSFLTEANYTTLKDGIKAGDALIVGFGHNDEKVDDADRYTSGTGDWQTEGSFAKSLYDNYVKLAQDAGAEAILCTPIVRRTAKDAFSNSEVHVTAQGDYPEAIRQLGTDKSVAVVDLTAQTKALYEEMTSAQTLYLHSWTNSKEGSVDNTHLNIYGAKVVARMLAGALMEGDTELGKHVVLGDAPNKDTDLVVNEGYVEKDYASPTTAGKLGKPYVVGQYTFRPTAFGDLGGDPYEAPNHILETDADGNMHIAVLNNKGKIASSADGVAMYYVAVPVGKLINFSATAKVNDIGTSNPQQGAFGLMARDDMYIDLNDKTINSDYVAAGTLGNGSTTCFYRKGGAAITKTSALPDGVLAVGKSYQLSIVGNPDGFTCTFDDQPPQSGGFDFALTSVDSNYYYVGLFCARNLDVTFSNIKLEITGTAANPDLPDEPEVTEPPAESEPPAPTESAQPSGAPNPPAAGTMVADGWLETLYAEIAGVKDADVTAVKYSGTMTGELTGDDLTYLVRDVDGKVRIDIPGLKAGKYDLTVTAGGKDYTAKDIQVQAHDRSGFAHQTVDANNVCTPYTEGVGAYKDDGTLKDNALVLYVTDANKDTVTASFTRNGDPKTITGIGRILHSNDSKANQGLLEFLAKENKRPLVVRFIGTVNQPQGVTAFKAGASNGGMVQMLSGSNITLEGIGTDATIQGWGFSFGADKDDSQYNKQARNFEVRNLSFKEVPEDCVEITGFGNVDGTIKEPVEHTWVHNCSFYRPSDIKNPAEDDKVQGDGALDYKWGRYMTSSYNYFERNHKTSLVGGANSNQQYHITWHHNYWKDVESRAPLARQADMHIYNNLYEGQSSYCMSLRANVYIFSEANTFLNCANPFVDEKSGGVVKSYQDVFTNCTYRDGTNTKKTDTVEKHATVVTDKTQTVTSANVFANFDTATGSYVAKGAYLLDTVADARKNIETWCGVMKAAKAPSEPDVQPSTQPSAQPSTQPSTQPSVQPSATPGAVTGVSVAQTARVQVGGSKVLTATVTPATAANKGVYWTSDDTSVATVDQTGRVTGVKAGTANITVKTDEGGFTATCKVTVSAALSGGGGAAPSSSSVKPSTPPVEQPSAAPDAPVDIDPDKPASENFGDVAKDSWYEAGVTYVVKKGLFRGVAQGVFAPQQDMTRAMLMTVLARLDGQDTTGGDTWYAKGQAWAMEKNISDGTMLDMSVTREQMVTMLYRYAKPEAAKGDLSAFVDGDQVTDWAKEAMTWAVANGILTGKDGARLDSQGTATRAEVATILQRFVETTEK